MGDLRYDDRVSEIPRAQSWNRGMAFFIWSVKGGQYYDIEGPKHRVLEDDDKDFEN